MDRSQTLTGGDLWNVLRTPEDRLTRAAELFSYGLNPAIAARFPLSDGALAHALLESRKTSGKILLIP